MSATRKRRDRYFTSTACAGSAGAKRSAGTQTPMGCGAGGALASSEPSTTSVAAPTTAQAVESDCWGKVTANPGVASQCRARGEYRLSPAIELPVAIALLEVGALLQ